MNACIGDQVEHAALTGYFVNTHLHARVHRADQHIDLVALHQFVGVFDGFGRLGFIVHLEPFDLTSTELATLFADRHANPVFDGHAKLGKSAGIGQHEAHADLAALG